MKRHAFILTLVSLALALLLTGRVCAQQPSTTQVIELNPGWNLISTQVGSGITPAAFKASFDVPATLIEIWGYVPTGDPLTPGHWNTYQPTLAGFPNDLDQGRDVSGTRYETDAGPFSREINGSNDTRQPRQGFFDATGAGRASHAVDCQVDGGQGNRIHNATLLPRGGIVKCRDQG